MKQRFTREPIAQGLVVLRRERNAAGQRANIKAGSADDDRALSTPSNIADRVERIACVTRRRIALRRIEKADEMMRHARELLRRRCRRTDRHPAIDLPRIRADDLRIELLAQARSRARSFRSPSRPRE